MRLVRFSLRTVRLAGILFLAILSLTALAFAADKLIDARQADLIEQLRANYADAPEAFVEKLRLAQMELTVITPPGMEHPLHQPYGMMSFDPKGFPEEFLKGLVYDLEAGCPVYTITVQENPKTGEIHFYNGEDAHFFTLQPTEDYDFRWLVSLLRPETYDAKFPAEYRADIEYWLDPARVEIELQLIPAEYIETYAAKTFPSLSVKVQSLGSKIRGGGIMLMRLPAADSNIVIQAITTVTNGTKLEIGYPSTFTNRIEIFACTDLVAFSWSLSATNLSTTGTNTIWWTDTTTNLMIRFYAAGNADLDNDTDGLTDAREKYLYHSSPTNIDSDNDGLVDGFSGVVATNTYPGGAHTNGGPCVEGELSWSTDANRVDTDDDGVGDGWEVANGHNPTNWNDPPNVRGTVTYTGRQTGTVWIVAVTNSAAWSTNALAILATPGAYRIPHLEATNYWIKAWLDSNASGTTNATEARGNYTNSATVITNRVLDIDITLADPDDNTNSLPDWWEVKYSGSTTNWNGSGDPDGDHYTNLEEYQADTDPTNTLSHPWNLSGTVSYTGPQTGVIHIIACTSSNGWVATQSTTNAAPGAFTITHLPPDANYWIKAWRDTSSDGSNNYWEASGEGDGNPVYLDSEYTGVNVVLADPDNDGDSISDWWELKYGLNPAYGGEDGAAAWWQLDAVTGTNVLDSTANANHGTLGGTTGAVWSLGIIGNGLIFNGTNAFVEVPDSASLDPNFVSLGLWVKPGRTYTNGTAALLSKKPAAASAGYALTYTNGGLSFTICSAGAKTVRWPCALTADVPVHVAATYGGSWQRLYINGALAAQSNYNWGTDYGYILQDTNALRLGASADPVPTNFFAGLLDDVRIYSGEWTTNQIRGIYELGADPDRDGLSNAGEFQAGSNPTNSDTDADGMVDGWEARYGLNATNSADAYDDPDHDNHLNIYEYKWATDPSDPASIPAATRYVSLDGSDVSYNHGNYSYYPLLTIQRALAEAINDCEIIEVAAASGAYSAAGDRELFTNSQRRVMIRSSGGPDTAVINCMGTGCGAVFESGTGGLGRVLSGFTITNADHGVWFAGTGRVFNCKITGCDPAGSPYSPNGGGVYVLSGAPWIRDTTVVGNKGQNGAGFWIHGSGGTIENSTIEKNQASQSGGGLYLESGAAPRLIGTVIADNTAYSSAGGMDVTGVSQTSLDDCEIRDNSAREAGGLYCRGGSSVTMTRSLLTGNQATAGNGGGFSVWSGGVRPTFDACVFQGNTASGAGGGLYLNSTTALVQNCVFLENVAAYGGGLSAQGGSVAATHVTFKGNVATASGGALYGALALQNAILWGNGSNAVWTGGGLTVNYSTVEGGYSGTGNLTNSPSLFSDGHLKPWSPCIAAGTNGSIALDIDGEPRPASGPVDIGADQVVDADIDWLPDWWELVHFEGLGQAGAGDADSDGLGNFWELQADTDPSTATLRLEEIKPGRALLGWTANVSADHYEYSLYRLEAGATNYVAGPVSFGSGTTTALTLTNGLTSGKTHHVVVRGYSGSTQVSEWTRTWAHLENGLISSETAFGWIGSTNYTGAFPYAFAERNLTVTNDLGWDQFEVSACPDGAGVWNLESDERLDLEQFENGTWTNAVALVTGPSNNIGLIALTSHLVAGPGMARLRAVVTAGTTTSLGGGPLSVLNTCPTVDFSALPSVVAVDGVLGSMQTVALTLSPAAVGVLTAGVANVGTGSVDFVSGSSVVFTNGSATIAIRGGSGSAAANGAIVVARANTVAGEEVGRGALSVIQVSITPPACVGYRTSESMPCWAGRPFTVHLDPHSGVTGALVVRMGGTNGTVIADEPSCTGGDHQIEWDSADYNSNGVFYAQWTVGSVVARDQEQVNCSCPLLEVDIVLTNQYPGIPISPIYSDSPGKKWVIATFPEPDQINVLWDVQLLNLSNADANIKYQRGTSAEANIAWLGTSGDLFFTNGWLNVSIRLIDGSNSVPQMLLVSNVLTISSVQQGDCIIIEEPSSGCRDHVAVVKNFSWNDLQRLGVGNLEMASEFGSLDNSFKNAIVDAIVFCLDPRDSRAQRNQLTNDCFPDSGRSTITYTNFHAAHTNLLQLDIPSCRSIGEFPLDYDHMHFGLEVDLLPTVVTDKKAILQAAADEPWVSFPNFQSETASKLIDLLNATYSFAGSNTVAAFLLSHTYEFGEGAAATYVDPSRAKTLLPGDPIRNIRWDLTTNNWPRLSYPGQENTAAFSHDPPDPSRSVFQMDMIVNRHGKVVIIGGSHAWSGLVSDALRE